MILSNNKLYNIIIYNNYIYIYITVEKQVILYSCFLYGIYYHQ